VDTNQHECPGQSLEFIRVDLCAIVVDELYQLSLNADTTEWRKLTSILRIRVLQTRPVRIILVGRILPHTTWHIQTMNTRESVHSECAACGDPIHYGQPAVSFCRNTEQREVAGAASLEQITVMESQQVLTLCEACGDFVYHNRCAKLLRTELKRRQNERN
jgi:hypothetical protein